MVQNIFVKTEGSEPKNLLLDWLSMNLSKKIKER